MFSQNKATPREHHYFITLRFSPANCNAVSSCFSSGVRQARQNRYRAIAHSGLRRNLFIEFFQFMLHLFDSGRHDFRLLLQGFPDDYGSFCQCLAKTRQHPESIIILSEGARRSADPMFYNIIGSISSIAGDMILGFCSRAFRMIMAAFPYCPVDT